MPGSAANLEFFRSVPHFTAASREFPRSAVLPLSKTNKYERVSHKSFSGHQPHKTGPVSLLDLVWQEATPRPPKAVGLGLSSA